MCDVVTDLCVEFLYLLVSRGRGVDGISFNNKFFGGFIEVRYHVRYVEYIKWLIILRSYTLSIATVGCTCTLYVNN